MSNASGNSKGAAMQFLMHDSVTAIYYMMFWAFLAIGAIEVVIVLYCSIPMRQRVVSGRGLMWQRGFLVLTVLLGWGTVLLGLYWVFPQQLLAFGSYARGSQPQMLEWEERLSVIAAIVMTMVAHVLIRYKDTEGE